MTRHHVKITSSGKGGRIEVDGEDVSAGLSGVSVRLDARDVAEVEFHLHLPTVEIDGEYEVRMSDATWDTLRSLGWVPPRPYCPVCGGDSPACFDADGYLRVHTTDTPPPKED